MEKLLDSLSQIERTIIPHLNKNVDEIVDKTGLDKTTVLRALTFLESKGLIKIEQKHSKVIEAGENGKLKIIAQKEEYSKKFPEELILEKTPLNQDTLSEVEKAAVESLKNRKNIIEIIEKKDISFQVTEKGEGISGKHINLDLI